jgi:two-component system chemotaxis response regulator CheY
MSLTFSSEDIPAPLKRKRILLVANTPSFRALYASFLRSQGFEYVFEAGDGMQAIDILRVQPIDLIMSDWHLEELSGFDLLHTVRGSVAMAQIPFVMLTTKKDVPRVKAAIDLGAIDYLMKPFRTAQLAIKLVKVLATSNYLAPKVIREEIRICSILDSPIITDEVSLLKKA